MELRLAAVHVSFQCACVPTYDEGPAGMLLAGPRPKDKGMCVGYFFP